MACGILVPWPRIELGPLAGTALSPNHWTTREVPETFKTSLCPGQLKNSLCLCCLKELNNLKNMTSFQLFCLLLYWGNWSFKVKWKYFKTPCGAGRWVGTSINQTHLKDSWVLWTEKQLNSLKSLTCFKQVSFYLLSLRLKMGFQFTCNLPLRSQLQAGGTEVELNDCDPSRVRLEFGKLLLGKVALYI